MAPVLKSPNFSKPFTIQGDANGRALGSVITQIGDDGLEHPVVYIIRTLTPAEKNYTVSELECLAVIWSIERFRAYVKSYSFTVITYHATL